MAVRLVLWDIDGTLVRCGPAAREALEVGARLAGNMDQVPDIVMSGKTDRQIMRELLAGSGLSPTGMPRAIAEGLAEAERALASSTARLAEEGRVQPGVTEVIDRLAALGIVQSVVTGNTRANAALKLAVFGLDRHIDGAIGAYGDDDEDRNCLVPISLERAARSLGGHIGPGDVWVVGDTARDLECARAAGVCCLLVGTGRSGFESIRHLGADQVLEDMSDTDQVLELLGAASGQPWIGPGTDGHQTIRSRTGSTYFQT